MKNQKPKTWKTKPVVFLPKKLDLIQLVSENIPFKEFKMEKAEYIISLIFEIPANNKNIDDKNGFVTINAKTLETIIWDYKKYLDYFIQMGVLETDGYYINGEKSKSFRINEAYNSEVIPQIRKTKKVGLNYIEFKGGKKKYGHLFKWFDERLTIEVDEAVNYLQEEFANNMKGNDKNSNEAIARLNRSIVNVYKIHYGAYNVTIDNNIARLHSPLTNLRSDLRPFLRYDGKKLASIDIKNSQPYLSARILDIDFWSSATHKNGVTDVVNKVSIDQLGLNKESIRVKDIEVYIMIWKKNESQYSIELQTYLNLILTGGLYEFFQPYLIQELGEEYHNRKLVKQQILMCLYSDNVYFKQPKAATKRIFERLFPNVYRLFSMIKERDKRHLSWILQRIESYAMLEIVTKKMAKDCPETPIFTIHDSILTTIGNEDYVDEFLTLELTKLIGHMPTLKVEREENCNEINMIASCQKGDNPPISLTPPFYPVSYEVEGSLYLNKIHL